MDAEELKKQLDGLRPPDQIIPEEEVVISRIEERDDDVSDEKPITSDEQSDFKVSIREEFDDENDIKITVKEDSYISESKPDIEPEEFPKYKFPTF